MPTREDEKTSTRKGLAAAQPSNRLCTKCGSHELRRKPRSLPFRLLSLSTYACGRCANRETRFRLSAVTFVAPIVLLLIAGAVAWFATRPGAFEDNQQSTADALARARTGSGPLSTFEQMMLKKPRSTLDNATILQLWRANVGVNVILQMIRTSNADYDVSASAIIELKQAGVDQNIILAMIDATYNVR
jgi:hypothetical protein